MQQDDEIRELRRELAGLDAEIPGLTATLKEKVARHQEVRERLAALAGEPKRRFRVIEGGLLVGVGVLGAAVRYRPRRLVMATASTAVVGTTVFSLAISAPALLSPATAAPAAPAVVYVPSSSSAVPTPSQRPTPPPVAPPTAPAPAAPATLPAPPGAPSTPAPVLSVSVSVPPVPVPLPSVTVTVSVPPPITPPITPSPSGTCLLKVKLPPVIGACVL